MSGLSFLLLLLVGSAELRSHVRLPPPSAPGEAHPGRAEDASAVPRTGAETRDDPSGYFTTPRLDPNAGLLGNSSSTSGGWPQPLGEASYWAYALMLLALVLFSVGMVGNLALMCTVWHNVYLQSAWNCILAGMALLDFLVLFFCLPIVVFHELTSRRLLGEVSCRLVPYLEVTSLGVATFSLCALSIDRFRAATANSAPRPAPESCHSILSKMSVIWLGSLTLAAPELPLWRLRQEAAAADVCEREPSERLPDGVYSLVLTYREARAWWMLGCYVCLPLLFTLACDLVTRRVSANRPVETVSRRSSSSASSCISSPTKKKHHHHQRHRRQPQLRSIVAWLTALYVACNIPDSICSITLTYVEVPAGVTAAASLAGHFFLFARCAATPVLLLCLCRQLGQAFLDCCCCCCDECRPDAAPPSPSAASSPTTMSLAPSSKMDDDASRAIGTPC
ncbi:G-protein coupled receptor 37-like 1 [Corythoichthys intestinalis]|uniref:G-protein coupled receptor 37-like 1 n=1 Tax=Corythoichthys intestinalis TaxID=161448 RepID=UPI0025A51B3B|nr:G-protein coupled receptor 37-like 1 [Corythoichthys intestinalis]